jgi:GT2 family glycosyltransferase
MSSQQQALTNFQTAREHYLARRFAQAHAIMQRYRQAIDYAQFEQTDQRPKTQPEISVVIVSYQTNQALLDCLESVSEQQGPRCEIILVDNGGNQSIHTALAKLPLLWIKPPINLLPSEGRNLGAHFARSELLVFLDDDAIMAPGYLAEAIKAMADPGNIALRGRIAPKTQSSPTPPKQYDLGENPFPHQLNLEGNCVIRRSAYQAVQGFAPLMFGHEGKELTQRLKAAYPDKMILYWPQLIIHHDYAEDTPLAAKQERQAIAQDYLRYLKEHAVNEGISILVRAGDDLAAAKDFLASLAQHNTYKPIEVLLWAKDSQQALATTRAYLAQLFVRVLPSSTQTLGRIGQQARYDNLLIVDLPTPITSDVLPGWLQQQQTNQNTALLCSKPQLAALAEATMTTELAHLANKLGKPLPKPAPQAAAKPAPQAKQPPPPEKSKAKPSAASNKPQANPQPKPELAQKIRHTEAQIQQIEAQIAQTDADIAKLESQYLPLPENTPEKRALKDKLEDRVLVSCCLLLKLKNLQDNLQEMRIRSICGA